MSAPVLIDTGCIVALLDVSERHHSLCADAVTSIRDPLITCEAVIAESCYLLRRLPGAAEAVLANVENGVFKLAFRLDESASVVKRLLAKYKQMRMDFADACLVCMAAELKTGRILTLDGDFSFYRWQGRRPFENLLAPLPH